MPVAALILGIIALLLPGIGAIPGIVAIVLGIVALNRRAEDGMPVPGKSKAIAGIVTGGLSIVLLPVLAGHLIPAIAFARQNADAAASGNHMRSIVTACLLYSSEHGGRDALWPTDLAVLQRELGLSPKLFQAPGGAAVEQPHYLYVRPATNVSSAQIILIENPAIRPSQVMAAFGDLHIARLPKESATMIWAQAQHLARSPEAADQGVPASAWTDAASP